MFMASSATSGHAQQRKHPSSVFAPRVALQGTSKAPFEHGSHRLSTSCSAFGHLCSAREHRGAHKLVHGVRRLREERDLLQGVALGCLALQLLGKPQGRKQKPNGGGWSHEALFIRGRLNHPLSWPNSFDGHGPCLSVPGDSSLLEGNRLINWG